VGGGCDRIKNKLTSGALLVGDCGALVLVHRGALLLIDGAALLLLSGLALPGRYCLAPLQQS
jgi:hypothetical protein